MKHHVDSPPCCHFEHHAARTAAMGRPIGRAVPAIGPLQPRPIGWLVFTKYLIFPLLLLFSIGANAEALQIYELKHRSAEEMIPMLRPLLQAGAGLSGQGYTLFIRTDNTEQREIAAVIERLDSPARQLLISVRQGQNGTRGNEGIHIEGDTDQVRSRIYSTRRDQLDSQDQQLRVSEGNWATIRAGVAVPQVIQRQQTGPSGTTLEQGVEYRDVDSGFEVRPRINGDRVTLEIRPFHARPSPSGGGRIEQQELNTTVSGQLGEWIDLGGVLDERRDKSVGTVYATRSRDRLQRDIRVKVDALP